MCHFWKPRPPAGELGVADWKRFINSLKEGVPSGFPICFSGNGEPFLRDGILELIEAAIKNGFNPKITTNGYLVTEYLAKNLADLGLPGLSVSLDSLHEDTHDFLRGMDGVFLRVMRAIDILRKNKINICIATTIMQKNLYDIVDLVGWVEREGLSGINFQAIQKPFGWNGAEDWHSKEEWNFLWPQDYREVNKVIDELIELKRIGCRIFNPAGQLEIFKDYFKNPSRPYRLRVCNTGDYVMNIDKFGDLIPCGFIGKLGNIKDGHIMDIWFSKEANIMRDKIYNCQRVCHYLINCFFE